MKAFASNFSAYSTQDWLQKTEKDLKGKSLDELSWSWDDNMAFAPAYFESLSADFKLQTNDKPWSIGESFTVKSPTETNHAILEALNMGVERLQLTLSDTLSKEDWTKLLDKVILNYIILCIDLNVDTRSAETLADYLKGQEWTPAQLYLITEPNTILPQPLMVSKCSSVDIHIQLDSPAKHLANQMRIAEQNLIETKQTKAIQFKMILSQSFYHNIAWIQAAQIIWQNILDAHQLDPISPIHMVAHIQDNPHLDENTQKINATIQAISAVVSGVQSLIIHPQVATQNPSFERRINRNIQHLMKLESYMDQVMNPTDGAYYFEQLTKELAERAWTHFQELD